MGTGALNHDQDLFSLPYAPLLQGITLFYASSSYNGPLGPGWSHNHDIALTKAADGTVVVREGLDFYRMYTPSGNSYASQPGDTSVLTGDAAGYLLAFVSGTAYRFDPNGKILSITDFYGNQLTFAYDGNSDLTTIGDSSGRSIGFAYDTSVTPHRLIGIRDPKQTAYGFGYDDSGRLQRVVLPAADGGAQPYWEYGYYSSGQIKSKRDPKGNLSQYEYDSTGRLSKAIDPEGVVNPVGHTRSYSYASSTGTVRSNTFTEKDGGQWLYTFDAATGLVKQKKSPDGKITSFSYYADGRMKSITFPGASGVLLSTFYSYNTNGSVVTASLPVEGIDPATVADPATDSRLMVAFRYGYDTGNTNPVFRNRIRSVSDERDPANILTTSYDYSTDADGYLVTTVTGPTGATTVIRKNANGKIKDITDANSKVTSFSYRPDGLRESVITSTGIVVQYTGYDANGNNTELKVKDSDGAVRQTVSMPHDVRNRLQTSITMTAGQQDIVSTFGYDANDNLINVTDPEGRTTSYDYTYAAQVKLITDALRKSTTLTYGTSGCSACGGGGADKLISIEDTKHQQTKYDYDRMGRLTMETDPLGKVVKYTYHDNGQIKEKYDATDIPETLIVTYSYNNRGQVTGKQYADGTSETYTYDANGRLKTAVNANISYTLTYYPNGRLQSVADSNGRQITYDQYDSLGQRKQVTVKDGAEQRIIDYAYDEANRPKTITSAAGTFTYGYDNLGRRNSLTYPNGIATSYSYDDLNRLTAISHKDGATTIASAAYSDFDRVGNRKARTKNGTESESYLYDLLYRLYTVNNLFKPEGFQYDDVGNRTMGPGSKDTGYAYDAGNQMTQGRKLAYGYDNSGNQVSRSQTGIADKTWTQSWDQENRLIKVEKTKGAEKRTVTFKYDPFGRRVEKKLTIVIDGVTKVSTWTYFYDNDNIALEIYADEAGATEKTFYTPGVGVDEHLALERNGSYFYYHVDGLVSITSITDQNQAVVQVYEYDSFGMVKPSTSFRNSCAYTGREWDKEAGLYYYRARYYDPMDGRFIQKDPIGFAGGDVNLFAYVQNNPVNYTDPTGLAWFKESDHDYKAGRPNTIIPEGPYGRGRYIDDYVPAGHTFASLHDSFVGMATSAGLPDWLVNKPSMLPLYIGAVVKELISYDAEKFGIDFFKHKKEHDCP